jgi:hypothetical protein
VEISGERDVIWECWKDNVECKFGRVKRGNMGQKMRVGVEVMCVEIDSTQVIMIKKSKDGKWLKLIQKTEYRNEWVLVIREWGVYVVYWDNILVCGYSWRGRYWVYVVQWSVLGK